MLREAYRLPKCGGGSRLPPLIFWFAILLPQAATWCAASRGNSERRAVPARPAAAKTLVPATAAQKPAAPKAEVAKPIASAAAHSASVDSTVATKKSKGMADTSEKSYRDTTTSIPAKPATPHLSTNASIPATLGKTETAPASGSEFFIWDHLVPGAEIKVHPRTSTLSIPVMTDTVTWKRRPALEISLDANANAGCDLCAASSIDMQSSYSRGLLEFWVRGESGGEVFNAGLRDDGENDARRPLQVAANVRGFGKVMANKWTRVRIPFSALGLRGRYPVPESGSPNYGAFNWAGVRCLTVEIDKGRQPKFRVWIAGARLIRDPVPEALPQHAGYGLRNDLDKDAAAEGFGK